MDETRINTGEAVFWQEGAWPHRDLLADAIALARDAVLARQHDAGCWCFEFEADCTIPAEYILMTHFVGDIDRRLEAKLAAYLRQRQGVDGGWPLYYAGKMDISCSVKVYYALKLAGDDPRAPHMVRAREAILARGGAARANVFTRITLALFRQLPWRGVPFTPVEVMVLPRWFPFHLDKVSYWSRTVMVPLLILCSHRAKARNPTGIGVRELFTVPPARERTYFQSHSLLNRALLVLDRLGHHLERFIPKRLRMHATARAERWFIERLNGEDGLGAIFPAMVNAYEALVVLGYPADHPYRIQARQALRRLVIEREHEAYCQPCVSPVWDTALACLALLESDGGITTAIRRGLDWLAQRQIVDAPGDWQRACPTAPGGGWAFQYTNPHYPDLDDTAAVGWAMHRADPDRYATCLTRAADWLVAMQSRNGGFAAFDADNDHYYLNEIPFADHGALLDPPTSDVSARVLALLGRLQRAPDAPVRARVLDFLGREQEADGPWFGRWGTNYIYGTWSVLVGLEQAGAEMRAPAVRRAVTWLQHVQRIDGGWGETNDSYFDRAQAGQAPASQPCQTAWALLALMAAGEVRSDAVARGIDYLLRAQGADGLWHTSYFNAPGFPRVFYLKYHGYDAYFPLWALARFRHLTAA